MPFPSRSCSSGGSTSSPRVRLRRCSGCGPKQVFAIFIRAPREHVWQALTESDYTLKYYYASTVESDWQPGSSLLYKIGDDTAIVGEVIEATPPEKLVTTFDAQWDEAIRADPASRITWILEEAGPGVSKLTVVHDNYERSAATAEQVAGGMPYILSGLKTLLELGRPMLDPEPLAR